ncbi:MAG: zf-HC2 domain-containing protein [Terracidiphilus sp.]
MKLAAQHEIHPDAERLNAFAEQALAERERGEVLAHLAVCGRCRQVVALAREAAEAEAARVVQGEAGRPSPWWRSWGLVLAPAAALAAAAAVLVAVHVRQAAEREEVARVESQDAERKPDVVAAPAQPHTVATEPAPAVPEAKPQKTAGAGGAAGERAGAGAAQQEAQAQFVEPPEGVTARMPAGREGQENDRAMAAPVEALAGSGAPPAVAAYRQEQRKQIEAEAVQERRLAAKARPPESMHGAMNGGQGNTEQVTVTAGVQNLETRPGMSEGYVPLVRFRSSVDATTNPSAVHLPSKLPAASVATAGRVLVAIDKDGALFVSEDSGATWEPVVKQWTGRAVTVRRRVASGGNPETAPEAKSPGPESEAGTGATPSPAVTFEILNDQGFVWASADGKSWIAE